MSRIILITFYFACSSNFLLALLQENREARKLIETDPVLSSVASNKLNDVAASSKKCTNLSVCDLEKMKFSKEEVKQVSANILKNRCLKELHEVPYKNGARLSETESKFFPLIEVLHIN